jgi:hypothetical protein
MTKLVSALAALMALCGVAQAAAPAHVPLQPYRKIRSVQAVVAGHAATMLFDTGGGLTMISPSLAAKIGCQPWGRLTGYRMTGERIDVQQCNDVDLVLGAYHVRAPVVGVLDLNKFLPPDAAPLDGSIALDAFDGHAITIDLARNVVTVETPESLRARTRSAREGKLRIERQLQGAALDVHVAAATPRGPIWLQLDSGNGGALLVSKTVAPLVGLDATKPAPRRGTVTLLGGVEVAGDFATPDFIIDGNLGMPFLSQWVLTLDLRETRVWFARTGAGRTSSG